MTHGECRGRVVLLLPYEQRVINSLWEVYRTHTKTHDCYSCQVDVIGADGHPRVDYIGPECFIAESLLRFIPDFEYDLKVRR